MSPVLALKRPSAPSPASPLTEMLPTRSSSLHDPKLASLGLSISAASNDPSAHSITSSAMALSPGGRVRPSALAVLRLMTSSTFTTCWTGRSLGLALLLSLRLINPSRQRVRWAGPPSHDEGHDEGEQFNGNKADDQQCKRCRVVFEPIRIMSATNSGSRVLLADVRSPIVPVCRLRAGVP
jgi:hypothetical protein